MNRLREEIDKASRGISCLFCSKIGKLLTRSGFKREDFSIPFSLYDVSDVEHFVQGRQSS